MSDSFSRRDFVALGSAAAATGLLSGGVFAKGDETIKVGLIGCGGRGSGAIKDCMTGDKSVKFVAAGDVFRSQAEHTVKSMKDKFKERVDIPPERIFDGLDAYQKVLDAGVDLVILATSPGFRPYHLEAAIKAKKHVFCEKPVAVDGPGIRKCLALVEEAKSNNLAVVAGTQRRHQQGYIETIKQLHDGAIGEIVSGRCYWNGTEPWFHERKDGFSDVAYQINNWYHFMWVGGDHIVEQHVHNLDVINWVMGAHPLSASGMGGRTHRRLGDPQVVGNIFDHFAVEYEYPNGVHIFSYCRHMNGCDNNVSEAVVGTKGTCDVSGYRINKKKVGTDKDISPYVQEHIDMLRSIREGKPLNELQAVAESTMTAILGREATYTGKKLTWETVLNSKEESMPAKLSLDMDLKVSPVPVPGKTKFV